MTDMNNTTIALSEPIPNDNDTSIFIYAGAGGGACILILIVIVIAVVCRRKRRKRRSVPVNLPNPEEIDLPSVSLHSGVYQVNPDTNNSRRELPALPTAEGSQHPPSVEVTSPPPPGGSAAKGKQDPSHKANSPNYQNVDKFLFPDDDDDETHDYENNQEALKEVEDEQRRKRAMESKTTHANTLHPHSNAPSPPPKKTNSFQPTIDHSPKLLSSSSGSRPTRTSPVPCHTPGRKGYINISKSLENLDKRTVPHPPALPSDPVIKVPSMERHCSPPKAHFGKSSGYINQPSAY